MPRNFARYEQFLRVHALYDTLAHASHTLDDASLIAILKQRLGLKSLSPRTLQRDCDFLVGCGYHLDRSRLPPPGRNGWRLEPAADHAPFPGEHPTLLELVAFSVARDLLRPFTGTVLWSGIESLRAKIEKGLPPELLERVISARRAFHVPFANDPRLEDRPRLLSAVASAISEKREIDAAYSVAGHAVNRRLHPAMFVVRLPRVELAAWPADEPNAARPLVIDLGSITGVTKLDSTFIPRPVDPAMIDGPDADAPDADAPDAGAT